jgi:hypothetical protein
MGEGWGGGGKFLSKEKDSLEENPPPPNPLPPGEGDFSVFRYLKKFF